MKSALLRGVLMRDRQALVTQAAATYAQVMSPEQIEAWQLQRFNEVWAYCLREVPFYQAWAKEHSLPSEIQGLAELAQFPVLTKAVINERSEEMFQHGKITEAYSSGGSSGVPTRYPRGATDHLANYANTYAARGWWGLRPFDSYLHLWGHAHLFGGGPVQKLKRQLADFAVNSQRINAYDMSDAGLESHYQALLRQKPSYIAGYTSAVFKLARHIEAQGGLKRPLPLRGIVVTAETVTQADVDVISRVFGAPVIIEYGTAETGTIATSRGGSWPMQVLWQHSLVQMRDEEIHITTLSDRLFPLINYSVADRGVPADVGPQGSVLSFAEVTGRTTDSVTLATLDGQPLELSSILPVHALKSEPGITAVQFRQDELQRLRIFVAGKDAAEPEQLHQIFVERLRQHHPDLDPDSVVIERIETPALNKKGAQALFI